MTSDGTKIYIYNALNQLTQAKRASDNYVIATYTYNHNGLRRSKTVNGVTTTYNWDASGNLVREATSGSSTYFYYVAGDLVSLKKNNTTYIVHDNLRGDVEVITDTSGNIVAQAHYDPWGNQVSASGSLVQPMRYAGYYYDDETGLYYLKSRYYSPVLGRFLTKDDIDYIRTENPQTLNLYSYCKNNPVSMTDLEGTNAAVISSGAALAGLAAATLWLGAEAAKDYLKQTAADVWAALERYWADEADNSEVKPGKDHPYNPGVPTTADGFTPPKNWNGGKVKTGNGQYGYPDKKGNVWVPTNPGNAHGGSHWDVQHPDGSYDNVYPKSSILKR